LASKAIINNNGIGYYRGIISGFSKSREINKISNQSSIQH